MTTTSAPGENRPQTPPRVNRRQFVEGASATLGGLAASAYFKPEIRSLGVPGAQAAISGGPEKPDKKDKKLWNGTAG